MRELERLQNDLGLADLMSQPSHPGIVRYLVVELKPIKIRMDANKNHKRPHVHIDYGKEYHSATYAIDTGVRLACELDLKYDRMIKEWIENNRESLIKAWDETQSGKYPERIISELRGKR